MNTKNFVKKLLLRLGIVLLVGVLAWLWILLSATPAIAAAPNR